MGKSEPAARPSPHPFAGLAKAREISLTTFRRSGELVTTPVWFALDGNTVYFETGPSSGKLKRIRHTARVTLAPCTFSGTVTGPAVEGRARVIADGAERARGRQAIARRYGLPRAAWYGFLGLLRRLRRRPAVEMVYVAIEAVA